MRLRDSVYSSYVYNHVRVYKLLVYYSGKNVMLNGIGLGVPLKVNVLHVLYIYIYHIR